VVVKLLLDKDADPNTKEDVGGETPLHYATENGHQEVVKLLLDKDADPNIRENRSGATPLHHELCVK
jgi:ankyrin repeat protein